MEVKLCDLLKAEIFQNSKTVAGHGGLENVVSSINTIESTMGFEYARHKMLVVTSGSFLTYSKPEAILKLMDNLVQRGAAGLLSKARFFENHQLPNFMLEKANEKGFPLIHLVNDEATFNDFFDFFATHLFCYGIENFLEIGSLNEMLIRSIKTGSLTLFADKIRELSGRNVTILFNEEILSSPRSGLESEFSISLSDFSSNDFIEDSREFQGFMEFLKLKDISEKSIYGIGVKIEAQLQPMGSVWLDCSQRKVDNNDLIILKNAKLAAELEIRQILSFQHEEIELRAKFIDKLLSGELRTWHAATFLAKEMKYRIPSELQILVINPRDSIISYQDIEIIVSEFFQNRNEIIMVHPYEENTVVFLPYRKSITDNLIHELKGAIDQCYPDTRISLGLGRKTLLQNANIGYAEALYASQIGPRINANHTISKFEELGCYRMLCKAVYPSEMSRFCHDCLSPILNSDCYPHLDLIRTLRIYFENNNHLSNTAKTMHLHPNSVRYRLGIIEKSCKINLSNSFDSLSMRIAIALLDVLDLAYD